MTDPKKRRWSTIELMMALVAVVSPMFFLAHTIDGDELTKSGLGAVVAGIVLAVTQIFKAHMGND